MKVLKWMPFACVFFLVTASFFLYNLYLTNRSIELPDGSLCFDCGLPIGFPFTLYRTATIAGGEGFIWFGVFSNAVIAILLGTLLGFVTQYIWNRLSSRLSSSGME